MSRLNNRRIKYQSIEVDTTVAATFSGGYGTLSFETDKLYERVKGIAFQLIPIAGSPNTDLITIKKFEIGGREIYNDGMYLKNHLTSADVPLNKKFDLEVDEEAKGSKVDVQFQDILYSGGNDYKLIVTLKLENPPPAEVKK